jgi:hypothetical protein
MVKALLESGKLAKPGNSCMTVNPLGSQLQFFGLGIDYPLSPCAPSEDEPAAAVHVARPGIAPGSVQGPRWRPGTPA